jgi:hypothetical protein
MILNAKILPTPGFERQDVKNLQAQVMNAPQGFNVGPDPNAMMDREAEKKRLLQNALQQQMEEAKRKKEEE